MAPFLCLCVCVCVFYFSTVATLIYVGRWWVFYSNRNGKRWMEGVFLKIFVFFFLIVFYFILCFGLVRRCLYRVLTRWFYWVLPGFTGFYWVLPGFTGFYRVLAGFSVFERVLFGCGLLNASRWCNRSTLLDQKEDGSSSGLKSRRIHHDLRRVRLLCLTLSWFVGLLPLPTKSLEANDFVFPLKKKMRESLPNRGPSKSFIGFHWTPPAFVFFYQSWCLSSYSYRVFLLF